MHCRVTFGSLLQLQSPGSLLVQFYQCFSFRDPGCCWLCCINAAAPETRYLVGWVLLLSQLQETRALGDENCYSTFRDPGHLWLSFVAVAALGTWDTAASFLSLSCIDFLFVVVAASETQHKAATAASGTKVFLETYLCCSFKDSGRNLLKSYIFRRFNNLGNAPDSFFLYFLSFIYRGNGAWIFTVIGFLRNRHVAVSDLYCSFSDRGNHGLSIVVIAAFGSRDTVVGASSLLRTFRRRCNFTDP